MHTQSLYPLKFQTIYKDKIWGGHKIRTVLGKDYAPLPNCGETWELSGVPGNVSVVKEGPLKGLTLTQLMEIYQAELLGEKVFQQTPGEFPLLIKFIDANDDLSIQVHPNDQLAMQRHNSLGKTEMWYIFQADEGASLVAGFNRTVDQATYLQHLKEGRLFDILNVEKVKAGDVFFMPAGRVHSIGKGCLLAEIQQTSDVTYRIYDFDRKDSAGKTRELHTEQALDAIDYQHYESYKTAYTPSDERPVFLAKCPYFESYLIQSDQVVERDYTALRSFVIYVCFEGLLTLRFAGGEIRVQKGDVVLLPACLKQVSLLPSEKFGLLETYVPG